MRHCTCSQRQHKVATWVTHPASTETFNIPPIPTRFYIKLFYACQYDGCCNILGQRSTFSGESDLLRSVFQQYFSELLLFWTLRGSIDCVLCNIQSTCACVNFSLTGSLSLAGSLKFDNVVSSKANKHCFCMDCPNLELNYLNYRFLHYDPKPCVQYEVSIMAQMDKTFEINCFWREAHLEILLNIRVAGRLPHCTRLLVQSPNVEVKTWVHHVIVVNPIICCVPAIHPWWTP